MTRHNLKEYAPLTKTHERVDFILTFYSSQSLGGSFYHLPKKRAVSASTLRPALDHDLNYSTFLLHQPCLALDIRVPNFIKPGILLCLNTKENILTIASRELREPSCVAFWYLFISAGRPSMILFRWARRSLNTAGKAIMKKMMITAITSTMSSLSPQVSSPSVLSKVNITPPFAFSHIVQSRNHPSQPPRNIRDYHDIAKIVDLSAPHPRSFTIKTVSLSKFLGYNRLCCPCGSLLP